MGNFTSGILEALRTMESLRDMNFFEDTDENMLSSFNIYRSELEEATERYDNEIRRLLDSGIPGITRIRGSTIRLIDNILKYTTNSGEILDIPECMKNINEPYNAFDEYIVSPVGDKANKYTAIKIINDNGRILDINDTYFDPLFEAYGEPKKDSKMQIAIIVAGTNIIRGNHVRRKHKLLISQSYGTAIMSMVIGDT